MTRTTPAAFAAGFGIRHPIFLAPMAGAGGVDLATAAMAGGALGSLPCALLSPAQARDQVTALRARAAGPINLNFFCHTMDGASDDSAWHAVLAPFYAEFGVGPPTSPPPLRLPFDAVAAGTIEALRPELVSFHFGLPAPALFDRVRAAGALVIASATSVAEARWLEARGVDAVIAQGFEAGGHAGSFLGEDPATRMGTFALVPQIVDAVDLPVIAAGGIGDARGIAAALMLGASAVQIGTAYLHCPESLIPDWHRERLREKAAERTVLTNLFTGRLARGLPNRLTETIGPFSAVAPPFPHAATALAELRAAAPEAFANAWAGQAARLGRPEPAAELTERLGKDALALLGRPDWPGDVPR